MSSSKNIIKCPQCGHIMNEPDWRCPNCYHEFDDYNFDSHKYSGADTTQRMTRTKIPLSSSKKSSIDDLEMKEKILQYAGINSTRIFSDEVLAEFVAHGDDALHASIDIVNNPPDTMTNQAIPVNIIIEFAKKGNNEAVELLREIVKGDIRLSGYNIKSTIGYAGEFIDEFEKAGKTKSLDKSESQNGKSVLKHDYKKFPLCEHIDPDDLHSINKILVECLLDLVIVRENLANEFWHKGPIDTIKGAQLTADSIIDRVKAEAKIIYRYVANIKSLAVTIRFEDRLDVFHHEGPEDHLMILMSRRFINGGVDSIIHHVFRINQDEYKFAYMRE